MVRNLRMGRLVPVVLLSMLVSGCALPVPIQVASWALDGISYLATNKSVTDHGISVVTGRDCALLRVVNGTDICTEGDDVGTIVVDADAVIEREDAITVASLSPRDGGQAQALRTTPRISNQLPVNSRDAGRLELRDASIEREVAASNLGLFSVRPPTNVVARPPVLEPNDDQIAEFETAAGTADDGLVSTVFAGDIPEGAGLMRAWSGNAAVQIALVNEDFVPHPSRKPQVAAQSVSIETGTGTGTGTLPAGVTDLPEGPGLIALWSPVLGGVKTVRLDQATTDVAQQTRAELPSPSVELVGMATVPPMIEQTGTVNRADDPNNWRSSAQSLVAFAQPFD